MHKCRIQTWESVVCIHFSLLNQNSIEKRIMKIIILLAFFR